LPSQASVSKATVWESAASRSSPSGEAVFAARQSRPVAVLQVVLGT